MTYTHIFSISRYHAVFFETAVLNRKKHPLLADSVDCIRVNTYIYVIFCVGYYKNVKLFKACRKTNTCLLQTEPHQRGPGWNAPFAPAPGPVILLEHRVHILLRYPVPPGRAILESFVDKPLRQCILDGINSFPQVKKPRHIPNSLADDVKLLRVKVQTGCSF